MTRFKPLKFKANLAMRPVIFTPPTSSTSTLSLVLAIAVSAACIMFGAYVWTASEATS